MSARSEMKALSIIGAAFGVIYFIPLGSERFSGAVMEALRLTQWYAREHVILCLIPAFFIAGAIGVFVSQASVMKYLGAKAGKVVSYGVASVSGSVLAVCSCTILPLFVGIYRMGAGLGPATAFLYAGPAINVLAIILTARVLGPELGIARAVGAILFSIVIGLLMHFFFRNEEADRVNAQTATPEEVDRPLWKNGIYFATMVTILVFANWGQPDQSTGMWASIYGAKWIITSAASMALGLVLIFWIKVKWWKIALIGTATAGAVLAFPHEPVIPFLVGVSGLSLFIGFGKGEAREWFDQSRGFAVQILPLLFFGVLIAGFLLGRPGHEGLIPSSWVADSVGGNSLGANLFASVAGAFMYFATLTEVPILQGLMGSGMGKGPALALLLSGPALSLPNMFVIRSVLGTRKTVVFVALVIIMATLSGLTYGSLF